MKNMKLISALLAVLAIACAGQDDADLLCDDFVAKPDSVERALAIGTTIGGDFVPIDADGSLELELGIQGGWMARPTLRIDAESLGATDQSCIWVAIEAAVDGMDEPISMFTTASFQFDNGNGYSDPLEVLLSFDLEALEGRKATFEIRVDGPRAAASSIVDVVLVNAE